MNTQGSIWTGRGGGTSAMVIYLGGSTHRQQSIRQLIQIDRCYIRQLHIPSKTGNMQQWANSPIFRLFWRGVLSSVGEPQVSMLSGKPGACLLWNVRGPMAVPRPRPPRPLTAGVVPLVSRPRRVFSPRPGPSKFSLKEEYNDNSHYEE